MSMRDVLDRIEEESPVTPEEVSSWSEVSKNEEEVREVLQNLINGESRLAEVANIDEDDVKF